MERISTYDSTLRDGEQSGSITLSLEDKLRIVERLDAFGVDVIEGGFPASNPKDIAFFERMRFAPLSARLAAFGSTCKKGIAAGRSGFGRSHCLRRAYSYHCWKNVGRAGYACTLQTTLEENLRMIRDSVAYLKNHGLEVVFDANPYDGYRANAAYALDCVRAASEAGANSIDLCETNGGALPHHIEAAVATVVRSLPGQQVGIHCHNDSGCAIANTLAAVHAGLVRCRAPSTASENVWAMLLIYLPLLPT